MTDGSPRILRPHTRPSRPPRFRKDKRARPLLPLPAHYATTKPGGGRGARARARDDLVRSWKPLPLPALISGESANYFECIPDRSRIKIRRGGSQRGRARAKKARDEERFRKPRLIGPLAAQEPAIQRTCINTHRHTNTHRQTEPG